MALSVNDVILSSSELARIDEITPGTQAANKAVMADSNVNIGIVKATAYHIGASGSEVEVTADGAEQNQGIGDTSVSKVVAPATGNLSLTAPLHAQRIVFYDDADGVITLPAATGTGNVYTIIVKTAFTAGLISVTGSAVFLGSIRGVDDDGEGATGFQWMAETNDNEINASGTATGGKVGDKYEFTDVAADLWNVDGRITQSGGAEATPFDAAA